MAVLISSGFVSSSSAARPPVEEPFLLLVQIFGEAALQCAPPPFGIGRAEARGVRGKPSAVSVA